MSLLNLNTSAGRGPRSKKSLKMFMGAGLLVAVLGIGSTLAANITLNSPEGTSEFGQGVTQTIYCGAEEGAIVKVTPASAYSNATTTKPLTINTITNASGSYTASVSPVTLYGYGSSNLPSLTSSSNTSPKIGWWYNSSAKDSTPMSPQPSFETVYGSVGSYWFIERNSDGTYKKPGASSSFGTLAIKISDELSNFKLGKVTISNIPAACTGVNFVLSSYGATSDQVAQTLSSGASSAIKEAAVLWNGNSSTTYPSRSRTSFVAPKPSSGSTCLLSSEQTSTSLTFTFTSPNISAAQLNKLVVETQEDAIGAGTSSCSNS